jgi:ATP-dependent protease ClpP protease subunit
MDKNTEKTRNTEPNENPGPNDGKDKSQDPKVNIDNYGVIGNAFDFQSDIQYLTIIGNIEGHMVLPPTNKTTKYENIIPQLVAIEENPNIKGLVTTLSKPTVSLVLGGGHSIGIPLATASHYSFIAESATMTLHPIRMTGLVIGAEPTYDYFRKMQDRVVDFIIRTSKADRDQVVKLMNSTDNMAADIGTILVGQEAVDLGLIDEVGGLTQALGKLKSMIENTTRVPKQKFKM